MSREQEQEEGHEVGLRVRDMGAGRQLKQIDKEMGIVHLLTSVMFVSKLHTAAVRRDGGADMGSWGAWDGKWLEQGERDDCMPSLRNPSFIPCTPFPQTHSNSHRAQTDTEKRHSQLTHLAPLRGIVVLVEVQPAVAAAGHVDVPVLGQVVRPPDRRLVRALRQAGRALGGVRRGAQVEQAVLGLKGRHLIGTGVGKAGLG